MVRKRRFRACSRGFGGGCRCRVHVDRLDQRSCASAQRRRPKKDGESQAIGRSRRGLATKIHAIVDALGNPVALSLTPGQAADITQAVPLLDQGERDAFIGETAYAAGALIRTLDGGGLTRGSPAHATRTE